MRIQKISKMKKQILNVSPSVLMVLVVMILGASSCKSRKNLSQVTPAEETEEIEEVMPNEEVAEEMEQPVVEPRVPEKILSKEQKLNNYFNAITASSSTEVANANIQEALSMFSHGGAPVLIMIYRDGANPDYDEPTTIEKYLNYLKDTKNKAATVEEVVYDSSGRIKELVLKK